MKKCLLHGQILEKANVEVRAGLPPAPPEKYFEAEEALFPQANSFIMGGCLDDAGSENEVMFCCQCRTARRDWMLGRHVAEFWAD
ncbi:MAG: hypothetical protein ABIO36_09635 [Pyrinomonadaceae bacterium]